MNETISYKIGETKWVWLTVVPRNRLDTVVVISATYILKTCDGTVVDSGVCTIVGKEIRALITAEQEGTYIFEATVVIGPETYKPRATIRVWG